jgi:hypothetical protein
MQVQTSETRTKKRSTRLAQLIRIYESGQVSELMDQTLDKLFSIEAAEAQKDIEELRADLLAFETRFGMESEEFYSRFEAGEMGDDADFIEWASFYDMYRNAQSRLAALSEEV